MTCEPTSNGQATGSGSGWTTLQFTPTTVGAAPLPLRVATLINNADGNGVEIRASIFALGRPITGPDQFAYDLWAFAARQGVGSGAVQYGDITSGVGPFLVPTVTTNASHEVLLTIGGIALLTIDWLVTVEIQSLRGAILG